MTFPRDQDADFVAAAKLRAEGRDVGSLGRARELLKLSASRGNSAAWTSLGGMWLRGEGGAVSKVEAERCFREAARTGDAVGEFALGELLYYEAKDYEEALRLLALAASKGVVGAEVTLAMAAEMGHGMLCDPEKAVAEYRRLQAVSPVAVVRLADCLMWGVGTQSNVGEAEQLLIAATRLDHPAAWRALGDLYRIHKDDKESAVRCFKQAAYAGDPTGCIAYGEALVVGDGCEPDLVEGLAYIRRAVDLGEPRAKFILAVLTMRGQGLRKDPCKAFLLCREAAESGEVQAQEMLAKMYERGDGTVRNTEKASFWSAASRSE